MLDELIVLSRHFIETYSRSYQRYFLQFNPIQHRCIILLGQRGVGKTTVLIQSLLKHSNEITNDPRILYIQTDHFLMGSRSLYEIADQFQAIGGEFIAFDEIHKYPTWSMELKSIYDTFPNLKILASGSSALEIHKGSHDLSRRAIIQRLYGMSFREFLELTLSLEMPHYSLDQLREQHPDIATSIIKQLENKKEKVLIQFNHYLNYGYYPYFLEINNTNAYWLTLEQNMHITIEGDLAAIYPELNGNSIRKIKQLLKFISQSVPFTPNWKNIKNAIQITDDRTLKTYFKYLEDACLIKMINKHSTKLLKLDDTDKIFLDNPNQIQAISAGEGDIGNIRETFFLCMLTNQYTVARPAQGDFMVDEKYTFEIGGRKKTTEQIKGISNAYVASDNMETSFGNKIPLWLFGFLY